MIERIFSNYDYFGFSGSRKVAREKVCKEILQEVKKIKGFGSCVGDAKGVDEFFRLNLPNSVVFSPTFPGRGGFAERSMRCVRHTYRNGGLWISLPSSGCPEIKPSKYFNGAGSGTWGSLAFAIGIGTDVLLNIPPYVEVPTWGFKEVDEGYYLLLANKQLSMF